MVRRVVRGRGGFGRLIVGTVVVVALGWGPAWAGDTSPLGTNDQQALDRQSVRIFAMPRFQEQVRGFAALFPAEEGVDADSRKMIPADAAAIAFNALQLVVAGDPERPAIMWSGDAPHHWFGMDVPFASYGLNNPDNIYRLAAIDGASRYEITGRRAAHPPAQATYFLYNSIPGDGSGPIDGPMGGLIEKDIQVDAKGDFTITIDADPANGRPNHIQSRPDAKLLIIRESLSDWTTQTPAALSVRRIAGPPPKPAATDAELADRAITLASKMIGFWMKYPNAMLRKMPVNTVGVPNARGGKWGYTANGRFAIGADEALIVTIDPAGAAYVGFQLADAWAIPLEFVHHTTSLTNGQAKPNADGTYSYVIAARDPGVYNWLDTTGFQNGLFGLRWQNLSADDRIAGAVRGTKLVKLVDLMSALPPGTATVTPAERRARIKAREEGWARRVR